MSAAAGPGRTEAPLPKLRRVLAGSSSEIRPSGRPHGRVSLLLPLAPTAALSVSTTRASPAAMISAR
jgi:hypothetical protein